MDIEIWFAAFYRHICWKNKRIFSAFAAVDNFLKLKKTFLHKIRQDRESIKKSKHVLTSF